ncbi:MAG: 6-carboxytetrahydropterin synthase [Chitinophagaceae bacterium]|nr:6-carboxytetrahydropterin synthase [Chitinophagaceae bacterium]
MNNKVAVYRKEHFNAAHRLFNPSWDDAMNFSVFGKCANPNFHGHNYDLIIQVTGSVDERTGYVMDMKELSDIIKEHVIDVFDHKNLNVDVPYFQNLIPTAENICIVIFNILREKLDSKFEVKVRLYETERNFVEYPV